MECHGLLMTYNVAILSLDRHTKKSGDFQSFTSRAVVCSGVSDMDDGRCYDFDSNGRGYPVFPAR
jgi:hypothetical protein